MRLNPLRYLSLNLLGDAEVRVRSHGIGSLLWFLMGLAIITPTAWAQESQRRSKNYALMIAVTDYVRMDKLKFPETDAKALGEMFESHGYEVEYLLGPQATRESILLQLDRLGERGASNGVCVVGFFGHGVQLHESGQARDYFCPVDTEIENAKDDDGNRLSKEWQPKRSSLVSMPEILERLKKVEAQGRVLLADCCREVPARARGINSGPLRVVEFRGSTPGIRPPKVEDLPDESAMLLACDSDQQALEKDEWGHGAFTKAILEVIDSLLAENKNVTTGKLLDEVAENVSKRTGKRQNPKIVSKGSVDLQLKKPLKKELTTGFGARMRLFRSGTFEMGSPYSEKVRDPDETLHSVTIREPFYLAESEVTQKQWSLVMNEKPWAGKLGVQEGDDLPAVYVSWDEANEFCRRLSQQEGAEYRLPTEAEWEYAARLGMNTTDPFEEGAISLGDYAWFNRNSEGLKAVGTKQPNSAGLKDMYGNVWEWCADEYRNYGESGDSGAQSKSTVRVIRGGSWVTSAAECRAANRHSVPKDGRTGDLGFRVLRVVTNR